MFQGKKIFLAAPYSQWMDKDMVALLPERKRDIELVRQRLLACGAAVFNAHYNEDWGRSWLSADVCTPLDHAAVTQSDVILAFIGNPPSGGVYVELGWSSALGKPILVVAMYAEETLISAMWGGDYEAFGKLPLYYEIGYYRILEHAAAHGLKRVEMGPTAYGAKMLRGYVPIRSDAYVLVLDDAARATVSEAFGGDRRRCSVAALPRGNVMARSDHDARAVLAQWGIEAEPRRECSGLNKDTWQVGEDAWLAADKESAWAEWETVDAILSRSELRSFEVPRVVSTRSGERWVSYEGRLWRMTESVHGRRPSPESHEDLASVAAGLARLHRVMAHLPEKFGSQATPTAEYAQRARELLIHEALPYTDEESAQIASGLDLWDVATVSQGPQQLIHGDPSYPNLRLDDQGQLTGLIDWESVRWDSVLHDLAVVGQTILYRSGWSDTRAGLVTLLGLYAEAGGQTYSLDDLLLSILGIKFESVAHHGQKLVDGAGDPDLVRSQASKIHLVCELLKQQ
ncbi:MAG: phosphotransferase [Propionibacteriaceae bacterium]